MMCNFDRLQKNVIVFFQTLIAQYWNANSNTPKLGLGGIGKFDFSLMSTRTMLFCEKFGKLIEIYQDIQIILGTWYSYFMEIYYLSI